MDTERWRSAFLRDVDRLAAAVEGRADRPVPTCPDWVVRDLVHHVVAVLHFWAGIGDGSITDPEAWVPPPEAPDDALVAAVREAGARLAGMRE